jgi:antitoxin YefM
MQTTYTKARENLAHLLDQVVDEREIIIIERRNKPNVALIAEDELTSLKETAYLLRSPQNAARLLNALEWSKSKDREIPEQVPVDVAIARSAVPEAIASLKQELGIGEEKEES